MKELAAMKPLYDRVRENPTTGDAAACAEAARAGALLGGHFDADWDRLFTAKAAYAVTLTSRTRSFQHEREMVAHQHVGVISIGVSFTIDTQGS